MQRDVNISRFLSLVLRHKPATIGLTLDANGWADVDELLAKMSKRFPQMNRGVLDRVVRNNDKQRFTFDEQGQRIRANQGHSVHVDLELSPIAPPDILLHGTVERFLDSIFVKGLIRGSRRHVHLSADTKTASKVGSRRGVPVLLQINAAAMHADGHQFYHSKNGVWLVDHVPTQYLSQLIGLVRKPMLPARLPNEA